MMRLTPVPIRTAFVIRDETGFTRSNRLNISQAHPANA
jgi:hypothetical protein